MRHTNPSGYVYYDNEPELCHELEKNFLKDFFEDNWRPILYLTKEVWIGRNERIDYFGIKDKKETYIEVKNWKVHSEDMEQILRYKSKIQKTAFYVICGFIYKDRRKILENLDIKIILTKDIKEINPMELVHWM